MISNSVKTRILKNIDSCLEKGFYLKPKQWGIGSISLNKTKLDCKGICPLSATLIAEKLYKGHSPLEDLCNAFSASREEVLGFVFAVDGKKYIESYDKSWFDFGLEVKKKYSF